MVPRAYQKKTGWLRAWLCIICGSFLVISFIDFVAPKGAVVLIVGKAV